MRDILFGFLMVEREEGEGGGKEEREIQAMKGRLSRAGPFSFLYAVVLVWLGLQLDTARCRDKEIIFDLSQADCYRTAERLLTVLLISPLPPSLSRPNPS